MKYSNCYDCGCSIMVSDNYEQFATFNIVCFDCQRKRGEGDTVIVTEFIKMHVVKKDER